MLIIKEDFIKKRNEIKGNIWQTTEWGEFQSNLGKTVFSITDDNWLAIGIKQPIHFGQNYLEIQKGPLGQADNSFFNEIKKIAKAEGSIFIRISNENKLQIPGANFTSKRDKMPRHTLILDLKMSEEEILKQMKQKGRYNIKVAQKKGVEIREEKDPESASEIFYHLAQETTERDNFFGHGKETYEIMLKSLKEKSTTLIAYFEDKPIAAGIFTFSDEAAIYYYGASSNKNRNLMAPYLIQWEAIKIAKEMNLKKYDFFGIAEKENNKKDPWYGVTQFKLKFGGEKISYPKSREIPINYIKYFIYYLVNLFR